MSRERRQNGIRERRRLENIRSLKQVAAVMSVFELQTGAQILQQGDYI